MTDFKSAIAALALAAMLAGAAEPAGDIPGTDEPGPSVADDDPKVHEWETVAPSLDSRDSSWEPAYKWFEDPRSLDCGERRACEDHKALEVAKAQSQSSTGAPR